MLLIYLNLIDNSEEQDRFEQLYLLYRKKMYYVANSILHDTYEAEDAVHNAFIAIARNLKSIKDIKSSDTVAYVCRAAKNMALNIYAKKSKQYQYERSLDESEIAQSTSSYYEDELQAACIKHKSEIIIQCINLLPCIYREVLYSHYVEEQSASKIAKTLGLNTATVKKRLVRGKKQLLELITKGETENE